jgi:hypothetical protein
MKAGTQYRGQEGKGVGALSICWKRENKPASVESASGRGFICFCWQLVSQTAEWLSAPVMRTIFAVDVAADGQGWNRLLQGRDLGASIN